MVKRRVLACALGLVMIVSMLSFSAQPAKADTYHGGVLTQNEIWGPTGNNHIVVADVVIPVGLTLEILPWTIVKFDGYYSIYVFGTLLVPPESSAPQVYTFTSNKPVPAPGDWRAIEFGPTATSSSTVSSSLIEYADYGIYLNNAVREPRFFFYSDLIRSNTYGIYSDTSTFDVFYSTITDNEVNGIHLIEPDIPGDLIWAAQVNNSEISHNGDKGIYCLRTTFKVTNSDFLHNEYHSTYSEKCMIEIRDSDFQGNSYMYGVPGDPLTSILNIQTNVTIVGNTMADDAWNTIDTGYPWSTTGEPVGLIEDNDITTVIGGIVTSHGANPLIRLNTVHHPWGYFGGTGIGAYKASPTITENVVSGLFSPGIGVTDSDSLVTFNEVYDAVLGLNLLVSGSVDLNNAVAESNNIHDNMVGVIFQDYLCGLYMPRNFAQLKGNLITDNTYGIRSASYAGGGVCEMDFTIESNQILGNAYGIIVDNNIGGDILYNTITTSGGDGIGLLGSTDTYISHNEISGAIAADFAGIYMADYSVATIEYNDLTLNDHGILCNSRPGQTIHIHQNNIDGNINWGVRNMWSATTVDATYNWWGDPLGPSGAGPGSGDAVSTYVDFRYWLPAPVP